MSQCVRVSGVGVSGTLVGNAIFNPDTYYITINDNTGYFESSSLDLTGRFTLSFTFTNMAATTDTAIIFESSFLKLSLENGVIKIYKNGTKVGDDITPYLGYNTFKIDGYTNPNDIFIMFGRTSATDPVHAGSLTPPSTPETVKFLQGYSGASLATAALTRPTSWVWIAPYEGYRALKNTDQQTYNCFGNNSILFENSTPGTYTVNIPFTGDYEVVCVGAGGPAAMRGVYDEKGYGWGGGSGGALKGVFTLAAGSYTVVVGSANNNTTAQSGNTQTLNPSDTTTHDSSIDNVVVCGGGGAGHYNTNYVGAAGAAPVLSLVPVSTVLNTAGNIGVYNSGGKGSAAAATCAGGASVYLDYGRGQGCKTSEYASKRSWIDGTNGYVRIRSVM